MKILAVIAILAFSSAIALWARPVSITCPYDGHAMFFEKQVGFGANAVCWYQHSGPSDGVFTKHEAYVPCND